MPELLQFFRQLDAGFLEEAKRAVAYAVAEELANLSPSEPPAPRLLEVLCQLASSRWVQLAGIVAIAEELLVSWQATLPELATADVLPPCLLLLDALVGAVPAPELPRSLAAHAPATRQLLARLQTQVRERFPGLAAATVPLMCGPPAVLPSDSLESSSWGMAQGSDSGCSEGAGRPAYTASAAKRGPVVFKATQQLCAHDEADDSFASYCLLPAYLPAVAAWGVAHSGLLLAGAGGLVEEWDLDVNLRLDRFCVDGNEIPVGQKHDSDLNVVALMAPQVNILCRQPEEVAVAAVNIPGSGGLAVLRRDAESGAWQVESPWPPGPKGYPFSWRHLEKVSRGEFLHDSISLLAVGQTSQLGAHEVGLYDTATPPLRPITTFSRHTGFVAGVTAMSAQTFASVSLDASLLLWDIRVGLKPAASAGFGGLAPHAEAPSLPPATQAGGGGEAGISSPVGGLASVAAARGQLLLCGSLGGELFLFDARALQKPLARPGHAKGAVVRVQLWEEGEALCAALATSEEGLCSLSIGGEYGCGSPLRALGAEGAVAKPTLCYDAARALGGGDVLAACGTGGVTRFRLARHLEQ